MIGMRRLIFHFYVNKDWETNPIYHVHKYFLKKYSKIFNEAIFIISVDDTNNFELIRDVEKFLIDCDFRSIRFVVEENTRMYEVETFNKYILQQMNSLCGLTFFAHIKGITDYTNPNMDKDAVMIWIASMYYLGLEFYKEAEWAAYTAKSCFFGGPMVLYDGVQQYLPKNRFMYSGSFYWLNCKEIYDRFNGDYPEIKNRYYAEHFPGNLCHNYNYEAYSHNYMMVKRDKIGKDMFSSAEVANRYVDIILNKDGEMEIFLNEINNLKKYLVNNGITY